jgi:O-antigen/teichoic acid export membrane protein
MIPGLQPGRITKISLALRSILPRRSGIFSVVIRSASLGLRFFILIYLGGHLDPGGLGQYGLVVATLSLGTTILGMEFYVHTMREILGRPRIQRQRMIRDQAVLHAILCAIGLPLVYLLDASGRWWPTTGLWLIVLLVTEHVCQESYRLLLTLSRPVNANVVLLFRQGLWALPLFAYGSLTSGPLRLNTVWTFWIGGNFASIALVFTLARGVDYGMLMREPVNWLYIRDGSKTSVKYVAVFLSFLFSSYCGRYVISWYADSAAAGTFFFISSVANVIFTIIETAFLNIVKPELVALHNGGGELRPPLMRAARTIMLYSVLLGGAVCVCIPGLIKYLNRPQYLHHEILFVILAGSSIAWCASGICDIALVALHKDYAVLGAHVAGAVVALGASLALVPHFGINGAGLASLLAPCSVALIKAVAALRAMRHNARDSREEAARLAFSR